jgi:hypothetical protein
MASDDRMINEWWIEEDTRGGTKENHENLGEDSRFPDRYFNTGPPEYETGVLTTRFLSLRGTAK